MRRFGIKFGSNFYLFALVELVEYIFFGKYQWDFLISNAVFIVPFLLFAKGLVKLTPGLGTLSPITTTYEYVNVRPKKRKGWYIHDMFVVFDHTFPLSTL